DILWLAARVDPAGARTSAPAAPAPAGPAPDPGTLPPAAGPPGGGPVPGEPPVELFPNTAPGTGGKPADTAAGRRGTPLRLPRTAALDDPLGLMRALRPLGRRSIGGPGDELDEQLTVERSIERRVPFPVLRPAESRWLDLALVVDAHPSMLLWADLVDELRLALTRSGVFRDVRTWQLTGTGSGGTPGLRHGRGGPSRRPAELADPAGRRLILVLSDTVAGGWREAPVQGVLTQWGAHNAVAVLNVLPERLWTRGGVEPVPFALRADRPAAATRGWKRVPVVRRARGAAARTAGAGAGAGARSRSGGGHGAAAVVPMVGLAPESLGRLVRVVAGDGKWRRLACLRLDAERGGPPRDDAEAAANPDGADGGGPDGGATGLEAVERFRASASPTAQRLAAHLAAVPLTLPVMTLVRRSLLRDAEHGHLAEVALGGLFAPWTAEQRPEETEFEFRPGVREALLGSQLRGDVAAVRELVRNRVWEYMSRNRGGGPDFSATRVTAGQPGRRPVAEGALPFAARPGSAPDAQPDPHPDPPPDPGLGERVVRVRFEPAREYQEVGILLTPRLVLTVGDDRLGANAVAWVRAGHREALCHPAWWDDASPRVFLLVADRDLADPAAWPGPLPWASPPPGPERVRVDGSPDQGEPVSLTGEVVPYQRARNGELVRLSAEPDGWTHYRGGPVCRAGELLGVVHGVWADRMVFLSGHALLEQPGFKAVLDAHTTAPGSGEPGAAVSLTVTARAEAGAEAADGTRPAAVLVRKLMDDMQVRGEVVETDVPARLLVTVEPPGALAEAGRLLSELPRRLAGAAATPLPPPVNVTVDEGPTGSEGAGRPLALAREEAVRLADVPEFRRRPWPLPRSLPLRLVLSPALYRDLRTLLPPAVRAGLVPLGRGAGGWLCVSDPVELARALVEVARTRDTGPDWPHCGLVTSDSDASGCPGILLPGFGSCLAHLPDAEQEVFLATLGPGSPVDLRGTTFRHRLLQRVLDAVREPGTRRVRLGRAEFGRARFVDDWNARGAEFSDRVSFDRAAFQGRALFHEAAFGGRAFFDGAVFERSAAFDRSRFERAARFRGAVFGGPAGFTDAEFLAEVSFARAALEDLAELDGVRAAGSADFTGTAFRGPTVLSGAVFAGAAVFSHATYEDGLLAARTVFEGPVAFDAVDYTGRVRFDDVRFLSAADAELPFGDRPDRWEVERLPDRVFRLRLLDADEGEDRGGADEDGGGGGGPGPPRE
ncbi:SAV_2336 N-terminal domain-related protein, partial [Streptomyces sp. NPDC058662]|uniref:SAV_2336 N-terminal domain-related protein n=1 Tax=Streptomyces sp. NPDC058662 TaxID=3346583 RepID=UPI00365CAA25